MFGPQAASRRMRGGKANLPNQIFAKGLVSYRLPKVVFFREVIDFNDRQHEHSVCGPRGCQNPARLTAGTALEYYSAVGPPFVLLEL